MTNSVSRLTYTSKDLIEKKLVIHFIIITVIYLFFFFLEDSNTLSPSEFCKVENHPDPEKLPKRISPEISEKLPERISPEISETVQDNTPNSQPNISGGNTFKLDESSKRKMLDIDLNIPYAEK